MKSKLSRKILSMGLAVVSTVALSASVFASSDTVAPTAPSNLTKVTYGKYTGGQNFTFFWTASTDNVAVDHYVVYAEETNVYGQTRTTDLLSTPTVATCTLPLPSNEKISYFVKAVDTSGNVSSASEPLTIYTDSEAPSAPTGLNHGFTNSDAIRISWFPAHDKFGVEAYEVYDYVGGQRYFVGSTTYSAFDVSRSTLSMMHINDVPIHNFVVVARDLNGNYSVESQPLSVDMVAPAAPTNLTFLGANTDAISIKWDAAIDNIGVVDYYVYDNQAFVGSTTGTTFDISRATLLMDHVVGPHNIRVVAIDADGNVSPESQVLVVDER